MFDLHSLRLERATAAADFGVNDRLFQKHDRWRLEQSQSLTNVTKCF